MKLKDMSSDSDTGSKKLINSDYEYINKEEIKEQSKPAKVRKVTQIETVAASNSLKSFNIQDQTTIIAPLKSKQWY